MPVRYSDQSAGPDTRRSGQQDDAAYDVDYEQLTKAQLQSALELRGLPVSGTKAEMIERLTG